MPPDDPSHQALETGPEAPRDREWSHVVLLLITVLLVLVGLVLLIVGYVDSSMIALYASIGCAALAGVVLIVYSRLNRRRAVVVAGGAGTGASRPPEAAAAADTAGPSGVAADTDANATGRAETAPAGPAGSADAERSERAATRPEPGSAGDEPGEMPAPG